MISVVFFPSSSEACSVAADWCWLPFVLFWEVFVYSAAQFGYLFGLNFGDFLSLFAQSEGTQLCDGITFFVLFSSCISLAMVRLFLADTVVGFSF